MDVSVLTGILTLVLGTLLAAIPLAGRMRKLQMAISDKKLIDGLNDTVFLCLQLTFRNPATSAKTIYQIRFQPQAGYRIFEVQGVPDFERNTVTLQPIPGGKLARLKSEDMYSLPLDIEPNRSKSVYFAVAVHPVPFSPFEHSAADSWNLAGYLVAVDHNGKQMARAALNIPAHSQPFPP